MDGMEVNPAYTPVANLVNLVGSAMAEGLSGEELLRRLWVNDRGFDRHVAKRKSMGHIDSVIGLVVNTLTVIAESDRAVIATPMDATRPVTGMLELKNNGWIVLLSELGNIITSYQYEPQKERFIDRHTLLGDKINEYRIRQEDREILKLLRGHARLLEQ